MNNPEKAFERGCQGKIKHQTPELALIALENIKKAPNVRQKVRLNIYKCRFPINGVDHWHVGRSKKPRKVQ